MKRLLFYLAAPLVAAAQIASLDLTAPTAGFRFDPESQSLRSIDGVPGAASLGAPLALGMALDGVVVAPSQRLALGWRPESAHLLRLRLHGATASVDQTEIPKGRLFFSPAGLAVAVVGEGRLEVWTDLAASARRLSSHELSAAPDAMAVSDDGAAVVLLRDGQATRLDGDAQELASAVADLIFLRDSHDLLLLQDARLRLLEKADRERQQDLAEVPGATRLVLSGDGSTVLVAAAGGLTLLPARGGEPLTLEHPDGELDSIALAQGPALFQIALRDGKVYLLDGSASPASLSLVDAFTQGGNQ